MNFTLMSAASKVAHWPTLTTCKIGVGYVVNNLLSFGTADFIGIIVLLCEPLETPIKCFEASRLRKVFWIRIYSKYIFLKKLLRYRRCRAIKLI